MPGKFDNKVALVTGGSSGIGRAAALAFARAGARVVVGDVNEAGGAETRRAIQDQGVEAMFLPADVSSAYEVEKLVRETVRAFGRLDCAFNNAGISGSGALTHQYDEELFDRLLAVHLKGVWLCMKHEIGQMLDQGGGAIVNTSSIAGLIGYRNGAPYAAAKHGVIGLTRTAALEYAEAGIRVNAVCPGSIETAMFERAVAVRGEGARELFRSQHPIGRFGAPEEVAEAVVWLCSDAASFVTGYALPVDGGWTAQ
jgi:NAD(P)-dependent dehydrogenase (short-subunit alcohol dehydrogenase family)